MAYTYKVTGWCLAEFHAKLSVNISGELQSSPYYVPNVLYRREIIRPGWPRKYWAILKIIHSNTCRVQPNIIMLKSKSRVSQKE